MAKHVKKNLILLIYEYTMYIKKKVIIIVVTNVIF